MCLKQEPQQKVETFNYTLQKIPRLGGAGGMI